MSNKSATNNWTNIRNDPRLQRKMTIKIEPTTVERATVTDQDEFRREMTEMIARADTTDEILPEGIEYRFLK